MFLSVSLAYLGQDTENGPLTHLAEMLEHRRSHL